jgi:hypothetical protein
MIKYIVKFRNLITLRLQKVKRVEPEIYAQVITPDKGYDALVRVEISGIPGTRADISGVTLTPPEALEGTVFVDVEGREVEGTMPNRGAYIKSMDGLDTNSIPIPLGYHNGSGVVALDDTIETRLSEIRKALAAI